MISQQTRDSEPMFGECWASVRMVRMVFQWLVFNVTRFRLYCAHTYCVQRKKTVSTYFTTYILRTKEKDSIYLLYNIHTGVLMKKAVSTYFTTYILAYKGKGQYLLTLLHTY